MHDAKLQSTSHSSCSGPFPGGTTPSFSIQLCISRSRFALEAIAAFEKTIALTNAHLSSPTLCRWFCMTVTQSVRPIPVPAMFAWVFVLGSMNALTTCSQIRVQCCLLLYTVKQMATVCMLASTKSSLLNISVDELHKTSP